MDVGGVSFVLTVQTDKNLVLNKVETSFYTDDGVALNQTASTDKHGMVSYELAHGIYLIRLDYLGYTYWTELIESPSISSNITRWMSRPTIYIRGMHSLSLVALICRDDVGTYN